MINTLIKKERTVTKQPFFIKYKTPLKSKENALKHNFVMHNQSRPYHNMSNKDIKSDDDNDNNKR